MKEEKSVEIDENAYSRSLAVFGHGALSKLMAMKVFIQGINGLGIEVAKNLILAGPKQVSICDSELVTIRDLGKNFYARSEHIGKMTRAEASID